MDDPGTLRIGTYGWAYKHWLHIFYPRGLSNKPSCGPRYDGNSRIDSNC